MIPIHIDDREVWYYPGDEEIPPEVTEEIFRYSFRKESLSAGHPRLRQIVVPSPGPRRALLLAVLHWDDGTDLALLDQLLADGAETDTAFDRALTCEITDVTCTTCHTPRVVAQPFESLPGASIARRRAHTLYATCPTCGADRYPQYAEALD